MTKQAIYFYKENSDNIPVLYCECSKLQSVVFPSKEELEHMNKQFPNIKNNLYALVDGVVFKLDF